MPKAKYDHIYKDLKEKIETEFYAYQQMLPSENAFVKEYGCSRNTVRRALAELTAEGYVQPMHGKGVRNIFQPVEQTAFTVGGIESFKESAARNKKTPFTRVLQFAEVTADEKIERRTGFKSGTELYYIQRLRSLDGKPLILDHNYFLKELTEGLTPEIAASSVYEYLENVCGITISTSKRTLTVEHVTQVEAGLLFVPGCRDQKPPFGDVVKFNFTTSPIAVHCVPKCRQPCPFLTYLPQDQAVETGWILPAFP